MKKKRKGPKVKVKYFFDPNLLLVGKDLKELNKSDLEELHKKLKEVFITEEEWERAINYIIEKLGKENLEKIKELMKDEKWYIDCHLGLGVYIRNLLRMGGFKWNAIVLDENWVPLLEDAVAEVFGTDEQEVDN